MNTDISVIIPAYQAERTVCTCVHSVMEQAFPPREILLVNDGSTDGTAEAAEDLEKEIPCLRVLQKEHGGVSAARNLGLREAKGEWILFLDADDRLTPNAFQYFSAEMTETTDACLGGTLKGKEPGHPATFPRARTSGAALTDTALARPTELLTLHGWLIRRTICESLFFRPELRLGEDSEWMLRVLPRLKEIAVIPEPVYRYTVYSDSEVHGWRPGKTEAYLATLEETGKTEARKERNWPLFVLNVLLLILTHDTFHPVWPGGKIGQVQEARRLRELPVFREALAQAELKRLDRKKRIVLTCFRAGWMLPVRIMVRIRQRQNARRA